MRGIGIMLFVAVPLAAADLFVKATVPTAPWAYHQRSLGWLALSVSLLAVMAAVSCIPSRFIAPAAGLLAAGVLGNTLSAAWNDMQVPNPLVAGGDRALIAFNLADVWAVTGIVLLVFLLGAWLIRNRALLPSTSEVRADRAGAFRRLFELR